MELYQAVTKALYQIVPDDPDATLDAAWIAKTQMEVNKETARLEAELKGYRNNLIKESIRVCITRHCISTHQKWLTQSSVRWDARIWDIITT